jgi:hypothetical protein
MKQQIALAIVLALGAGTAALAATPEEEQACTNDAFQFCQNYIPDRNQVFTCLVNSRTQLSPPCRMVMSPYFPPDPVVALKKPPASPSPPRDKGGKPKAPLSLAPH